MPGLPSTIFPLRVTLTRHHPPKFPKAIDPASKMGRFFKLATICFLTLVRRSIKFIATQQVILFRRPPWAFPPLTWAASFLAALFSSHARLFMLVYGRDFSR